MRELLIGERYRDKLGKSLVSQGIEPIYISDNPDVDPRLGGHVDLSIFKVQDKVFVLAGWIAGNSLLVNKLTNSGIRIIFSDRRQSPIYPHDANLCACAVGNRIIHSKKATDPVIYQNWPDRLIDVKQAYSKCSVCVVDDNAIITADSGIANKAEENGIEVLHISPGEIILEGFDSGFIGGASFADESAIYFTGRLGSYNDSVEAFIATHGKKTVYLNSEMAFDIGGAIFL